jgi:hypothetical protein
MRCRDHPDLYRLQFVAALIFLSIGWLFDHWAGRNSSAQRLCHFLIILLQLDGRHCPDRCPVSILQALPGHLRMAGEGWPPKPRRSICASGIGWFSTTVGILH